MCIFEYEGTLAFHPGYYVKEYMEDAQLTLEELAQSLDISPKCMNDLLGGTLYLTNDLVDKLSNYFGTSTTLWRNLNKTYWEIVNQ